MSVICHIQQQESPLKREKSWYYGSCLSLSNCKKWALLLFLIFLFSYFSFLCFLLLPALQRQHCDQHTDFGQRRLELKARKMQAVPFTWFCCEHIWFTIKCVSQRQSQVTLEDIVLSELGEEMRWRMQD